MGCKYSVSANANQNTVNVTGTFTNNGATWSNKTETFWTECNGQKQYMYRTIPSGASFSWTHSYNVGNSTSDRTYSVSAGGPSWSNFDNSSASTTVHIPKTPPSVTTPPVFTNQKAVLSGSTITISWTNNGSGTSTPISNYVDVKIDNNDWKNILNKKATSVTYSVSPNHRYQFRVNSYNDAGQSAHQTTNIIYTEPSAPSIVNANLQYYQQSVILVLQLITVVQIILQKRMNGNILQIKVRLGLLYRQMKELLLIKVLLTNLLILLLWD